jgi:hypothetical protein
MIGGDLEGMSSDSDLLISPAILAQPRKMS